MEHIWTQLPDDLVRIIINKIQDPLTRYELGGKPWKLQKCLIETDIINSLTIENDRGLYFIENIYIHKGRHVHIFRYPENLFSFSICMSKAIRNYNIALYLRSHRTYSNTESVDPIMLERNIRKRRRHTISNGHCIKFKVTT